MKTIIYLTENRLEESIAQACRKQLIKAVGDNPIISVSQKPIDLGTNICVGDIGRSWMNLYKQQLVGLRAATTKYIGIAEHDVMYTKEHFEWEPPTDDVFYYNHNCWFVEWHGNHPELEGMYSWWPNRYALSQLICSRELLIKSIEERITLIESGIKIMRKMGEPGVFNDGIVNEARKEINEKLAKAAKIATEDNCAYLSPYFEGHVTKFKSEAFKTVAPNLDIRHGSNFTGPRRGKRRTYELEPWGKFAELLERV